MTIRSLKGRLNNLTVGLCGDLKFGRTVHSLINALSRYTGIRFVLISPPELRVPDYIIEDTLNAKGIEYKEVENLDEAMPELDILYMTRVQRERFFNEEDYIRMKDCYILDKRRWSLPVMICLCSIRFRVSMRFPLRWTTTRVPLTSNRFSTAYTSVWL